VTRPRDDVDDALMLLWGVGPKTSEPIKKTEFPSATTKPTEQQCRSALARVLRAAIPQVEPSCALVLCALADSVEPEDRRHPVQACRIIFKNPGRADQIRDWSITRLMHILRKREGYNGAAATVAEMVGMEPRRIKDIYSKNIGTMLF
jgi:hypothetical protein